MNKLFHILMFIVLVIVVTVLLIVVVEMSPYDFTMLLDTGSMEPEFKGGNIIVVKDYNGQEINVGDVIVFKYGIRQARFMHRVIAYQGSEYITKGDNVQFADHGVRTDNCIDGVVVYQLKTGEYFPFSLMRDYLTQKYFVSRGLVGK